MVKMNHSHASGLILLPNQKIHPDHWKGHDFSVFSGLLCVSVCEFHCWLPVPVSLIVGQEKYTHHFYLYINASGKCILNPSVRKGINTSKNVGKLRR